MTSLSSTAPVAIATHDRHKISWGAVLAGVVAALVVQLILSILGLGLGALVSQRSRRRVAQGATA